MSGLVPNTIHFISRQFLNLSISLQVISEALEAYTKRPRIEWVREWPGQSVLAVTQKFWTAFIHEAINKGGNAIKEYLEVNNEQINDIVQLVRGKLSKQNRTTLQVCAF